MKMTNALLCLVCVSLVSLGQVLLRGVAQRAGVEHRVLDTLLSGSTALAIGVYAGAMLMWLFILTRVPLTVAFPFFGLCFLLVPIFANWIVGDPVSISTWLGGGIILCGVTVSSLVR